jgi:uncharacterized paraquat-inducible protein A
MVAAIVKCPTCDAEVSSEAAACPKCGHQFKSAGAINLRDPVHVIGIIVALLFLLGAIYFGVFAYLANRE